MPLNNLFGVRPSGLTNRSIRDLSGNIQTGTSYTLRLTDRGQPVLMNNSSANTLFIPSHSTTPLPIWTVINVIRLGAGMTTITAGVGVVLNGISAGSGSINTRYQGISLLQIDRNIWVASGTITTVS